ncbi:MAG TPA: acyltransferase family protein [Rubrobacteraceae bacterium]|nr:acyltransferase family protein [Rubrobacteraceae bacterium]
MSHIPEHHSPARIKSVMREMTIHASRVRLAESPRIDDDAETKRGVRLPHMPGLDGLRAFAVIAVLLYHADLGWIPGGFLGVEVFFVISGYLITALLLAEWRQRGRIDLKGFWYRRARRLLPALYLLLVVTLAFAVVFLPGEVAGLRSDALAAFGYVTNWYLVIGHESYFEAMGRPSLLKHLWSLAVEEQFYLLWPLLFAAGMGVGAMRYRRHRMIFFIIVGAFASILLMAVLYKPGVDPSRIYYGTDTRASGLLIGAALAFLWEPGRFYTRAAIRRAFEQGMGWVFPLLLDLAGLGALGVLVWFCLRITEFQPFLYRGGFACVGLATAVVIMVTVHPRTYLGGALLGRRTLRWVGVRSYGIYLWHWPVYMITRPDIDVPIHGWPLLVVRLAAAVALADLSYRFVETPIRKGALERSWRALREAQGGRRWQLGVRWAGAGVVSVAVSVMLSVAVVQAKPPEKPSYLDMKAIHTSDKTPQKPSTQKAVDTQSEPRTHPQKKTGDHEKAAGTRKTGKETANPASSSGTAAKEKEKTAPDKAEAAPVGRVTAIGDSVMLGAAAYLDQSVGNLDTIDAQVGLQMAAATDILRARAAAGQIGDTVIVHIGNNGPISSAEFDQMMQALQSANRVIIVNLKVPRSWEQPNNAVLAEGVKKYPKAELVDWYGASVNHPEFFWDDGLHLRPEGGQFYANLIAEQLKTGE